MENTATQQGVEQEGKVEEVVENPRNALLAEIVDKARQERDNEITSSGETPVATDTKDEPVTEESKEDSIEDKPLIEEPQAKQDAVEELITVKVDGELRQIAKDKIYEAGLRAVQKESTADKRLEEATRLLKEVEQKIAVPPQNQNLSPEWDDSIIAYALEHGDEAQKTEAVRQLRGREQSATPEQIAQIATANVLDRVDFQTAAEWFVNEYKEIQQDPYLLQLAALKESQMRNSGDQRPRKELYREIGDELRKWKGGAVAVTSLEQKREQKAEITNLPTASVRKEAPAAPKAATPSDIIEQMRKARKQA